MTLVEEGEGCALVQETVKEGSSAYVGGLFVYG